MRLLSRTEAYDKKKLEQDGLTQEISVRRKYLKDITQKIEVQKDNYDLEKADKLREFERFCADLETKRTKLLEELAGWQKVLKDTKDIYYGLVVKQDRIEERFYEIKEANAKLDLRQAFVEDLEKKWYNKQNI